MPLDPEQLRVAKRQELLHGIFSGLRAHVGSDFEHLEVNDVVLHNVVVSYFHDVDRHKHFHDTKLVDDTKQGAYTMKWIAKLRPIQFSCPAERVTTNLLYVNEIFAVRSGLAFMSVSPDMLPEQLFADLLYTLRHRSVDDRMLFLWLATLKHAITGGFSQASA